MKINSKKIIAVLFVVGVIASTVYGQLNQSKYADAFLEKATFAGGCFWCMEPPFEALKGVEKVVSGYSGGHTDNPTYKQVITGSSGHLEAVQVTYNPQVVSYDRLLEVFWQNIDPTDQGGQFGDRGSQYHTAIFFHNNKQETIAQDSKRVLNNSGKFKAKVATSLKSYEKFWPAEDYHQNYYEKNPSRYKRYKVGSGREGYIKKTWDNDKTFSKIGSQYTKPSDTDLRSSLSKMSYKVTQDCGTEPAFSNAYWDNKQTGIYVDIVGGEPLFSSKDKFKSGTGWPSFSKSISADNIVEKVDRSFAMVRTEVRSKLGGSHLGHLFNDGPSETGMRYCINSASLRFIPLADMEAEGYGKYIDLVTK